MFAGWLLPSRQETCAMSYLKIYIKYLTDGTFFI